MLDSLSPLSSLTSMPKTVLSINRYQYSCLFLFACSNRTVPLCSSEVNPVVSPFGIWMVPEDGRRIWHSRLLLAMHSPCRLTVDSAIGESRALIPSPPFFSHFASFCVFWRVYFFAGLISPQGHACRYTSPPPRCEGGLFWLNFCANYMSYMIHLCLYHLTQFVAVRWGLFLPASTNSIKDWSLNMTFSPSNMDMIVWNAISCVLWYVGPSMSSKLISWYRVIRSRHLVFYLMEFVLALLVRYCMINVGYSQNLS